MGGRGPLTRNNAQRMHCGQWWMPPTLEASGKPVCPGKAAPGVYSSRLELTVPLMNETRGGTPEGTFQLVGCQLSLHRDKLRKSVLITLQVQYVQVAFSHPPHQSRGWGQELGNLLLNEGWLHGIKSSLLSFICFGILMKA